MESVNSPSKILVLLLVGSCQLHFGTVGLHDDLDQSAKVNMAVRMLGICSPPEQQEKLP